MKFQIVSIASIVVGVILLGCLLVRSQFSADKLVSWSEQQAKEYQQAGDDVHRLTYSLPPQDGDEGNTTDPLTEAKARFARAQQDLRDARNRADRTGLLLKWGGIGFIAVGAMGFFASRSRD